MSIESSHGTGNQGWIFGSQCNLISLEVTRLDILPPSQRSSPSSSGAFELRWNLRSTSVSYSARKSNTIVVDIVVDFAIELLVDVDAKVDMDDDGDCGSGNEREDSVNEKDCGFESRVEDRLSAMLISPSINYSKRDDDHQCFNVIGFRGLPAAAHRSIRLPRPPVVRA